MRRRTTKAGMAALALAALVIGLLFVAAPESASPPAESSRLVSVQHLPEAEACMWDDAVRPPDNVLLQLQGNGAQPPRESMLAALETPGALAALQQRGGTAAAASQRPATGLQPVRTIRDLDPTYSSISLDLKNNEIILQDNNLWSYRVFGRTDNTPPAARFTEPK